MVCVARNDEGETCNGNFFNCYSNKCLPGYSCACTDPVCDAPGTCKKTPVETACKEDADCSSTEWCKWKLSEDGRKCLDDMVCVARNDEGQTCNGNFFDCYSNKCLPGYSCVCTDAVCDAPGTCKKTPVETACKEDADCSSTEWCKWKLSDDGRKCLDDMVCVDRNDEGQTCNGNFFDCYSNKCLPGYSCVCTDAVCDAPGTCKKTPVETACKEDADCSSTEWCKWKLSDDGRKCLDDMVCVDRNDEGQTCNGNFFDCYSNKCLPGYSCACTDAVCDAPGTCKKTPVETPCKEDADCSSTEWCKWKLSDDGRKCLDDMVCVARNDEGQTCNGNFFDCYSNKCLPGYSCACTDAVCDA
ncbi:hypothetical protein DIPPA_27642, partial [Diplonema papillatum]